MDWKPDVPRWQQVYEAIKAAIESGGYAPGDKLPSVLELTQTYGIANATAQKVLTQLRADGLTETHPGVGTFVRGPAKPADS